MKTLNENPTNPVPADKEFYDQKFNTKLQAEMFDNGPETESERISDGAMKGAAWLAGIVGLFALAVVIAAAFDLSPTPSPAKASRPRTTALRTSIGTPGSPATDFSSQYADARPVILRSITVIAQQPARVAQKAVGTVKSETSATDSNTTENNSAAVAPANESTDAPAQMTQADLDRIEREAREVIHGDYGNNPGRAERLGADYALVQARVNEILHI